MAQELPGVALSCSVYAVRRSWCLLASFSRRRAYCGGVFSTSDHMMFPSNLSSSGVPWVLCFLIKEMTDLYPQPAETKASQTNPAMFLDLLKVKGKRVTRGTCNASYNPSRARKLSRTGIFFWQAVPNMHRNTSDVKDSLC